MPFLVDQGEAGVGAADVADKPGVHVLQGLTPQAQACAGPGARRGE
jgi:hypothetical protein